MTSNKLSTAASGLIWFGTAVSLSEILTGTFLAPLGWERGVQAVILSHIIGCSLFFCAALIGAQTGKSAMETVQQFIRHSRLGIVFQCQRAATHRLDGNYDLHRRANCGGIK
nr:hypothetical protein [Neisseria weixii]